jgi:hypothetical protein
MADAGKITIDHALIDNLVNVLKCANENLPNLDVLAKRTVGDTSSGSGGGYLDTGLQAKVSALTADLAKQWGEERKKIEQMVISLKSMQSHWKDIESGSKQQADFLKSADPKA